MHNKQKTDLYLFFFALCCIFEHPKNTLFITENAKI